jgi:hypothetical protein
VTKRESQKSSLKQNLDLYAKSNNTSENPFPGSPRPVVSFGRLVQFGPKANEISRKLRSDEKKARPRRADEPRLGAVIALIVPLTSSKGFTLATVE